MTLLLAFAACKSSVFTEEHARVLGTVAMGNPAAASQLKSGFFGIEAGTWRWTAQNFAIDLRTPAEAPQKGAILTVKLTLTQQIIDALHRVTLSPQVNGTAVPPETYSQVGAFTYQHDVPASAFTGQVSHLTFALDKPFLPGGADNRALGIVVSLIGLTPK